MDADKVRLHASSWPPNSVFRLSDTGGTCAKALMQTLECVVLRAWGRGPPSLSMAGDPGHGISQPSPTSTSY